METMGVLDISLIHDVQKIYFLGDLILRQKGLLRHDGLYNLYNSSFDGNLQSLSQLLSENSNRMCEFADIFIYLSILKIIFPIY